MVRRLLTLAVGTCVQLPAWPSLLTIWTTPLRSPAGAGRRHAMTHLPSTEWRVSPDLTDYPPALADMEQRAAAIHAGEANERIWLLETPPLFTAGTTADPAELLVARFQIGSAAWWDRVC